MKYLKHIILSLVVLVLAGLLYVYFQPSAYNIARSKIIDVPSSMAYSAVNDLKSYELWGPWHDEDTTIVVSYAKKTVGIGAESSWTSMDGPGKMWITDVTPNQGVTTKLQFADYEPSQMIWTIKDVGGKSQVTWTMEENNAPFMFKIFAAISGGWDGMFGPMQEQGLQNLENVLLESKQNGMVYSFTTPEKTTLEGGTFVGLKHKATMELETMGNIFMSTLPKVSEELMAKGFSYEDFTPGAIYYTWDKQTGETEFMAGLYVKKGIEKLGETDLMTHRFEDVPAMKSSKYGNYGTGDAEAHDALNAVLAKQNMEANYPIMELFVNDPVEVKPSEIQTDIYYPIKS